MEENTTRQLADIFYIDFIDCIDYLPNDEKKFWDTVGIDLLLNENGDTEIFTYSKKHSQINTEAGSESNDD